MRFYEIMCILNPTLDEESTKKEIEKLENILKDNSALKVETDSWGLREFTYEIKKLKKGYYVIFNVETEKTETISEFDRLVKINNNILRHLIIKKEEK